jgi:mono/diheme cytochrome c family protein
MFIFINNFLLTLLPILNRTILYIMKSLIFLFLVITVVLSSCNKNNSTGLLSTDNLTSFYIEINSDSGYNLKTPKGASVRIASNSFDVPSGTVIKIEVKEAYSMQDILLAGLSTQSNAKPLRSAGMLYFGATVNNRNIKFLKPVRAIIPSGNYDSSMQVFKGEMKDDSTINWVNPQAIDTAPALRNLLLGKALFKANCANCHKPVENFTGPGLAGVRVREPDPEWAYRFINNVNTMFDYDPYARRLLAQYGSKMTQFNLKKSEVKNILDYCDNEALLISGNNSDSVSYPATSDEHPCGYDTFYYAKPKEGIETLPLNKILIDTVSAFDTSVYDDTVISDLKNNINEEDEFVRKGYKQVIPEQGLYQIDISESGWYNVDILFDDPNAVQVQLFAKAQMQNNADMTVYLFIPKRKILMNASEHKNDIYIFDYSDANGYLPLVLNDDAVIFASATIKDKIYYGIAKFKVNRKQTISIDIKESTKEEILSALKKNELDDIKIDPAKNEMKIIAIPCPVYPNTKSITLPKRP